MIQLLSMFDSGLADYRIAVIEDDPPIRDMYQVKFELSGFTVQTASDGAGGLQLCQAFQPHLILLDLLMPKMNGDEMLQCLRAEEWGADMRVIILTNLSRSEAPHALRFLGIDRYIVKAHTTPAQVVDIAKEVLNIKVNLHA